MSITPPPCREFCPAHRYNGVGPCTDCLFSLIKGLQKRMKIIEEELAKAKSVDNEAFDDDLLDHIILPGDPRHSTPK